MKEKIQDISLTLERIENQHKSTIHLVSDLTRLMLDITRNKLSLESLDFIARMDINFNDYKDPKSYNVIKK